MIKQIILDLDGTLLEIRRRHYQCYCDIVQLYNLTPLPLENYWQLLRTGANSRCILQQMGHADKTDNFIEQWIERIEQKHYLSFDSLYPNTHDVLAAWKAKDIQLHVVTLRCQRENLDWQLQQLKLSPLLDQVIVVGDLAGKIDKATAVRQHIVGLSLQEALWIGDTEADVQAAKSLGIKVCAVNSGMRNSTFLATLHPDYQVADLSAAATISCHSECSDGSP